MISVCLQSTSMMVQEVQILRTPTRIQFTILAVHHQFEMGIQTIIQVNPALLTKSITLPLATFIQLATAVATVITQLVFARMAAEFIFELKMLEQLHAANPWKSVGKFLPVASKFGFTKDQVEQFLHQRVVHDRQRLDPRRYHLPIFGKPMNSTLLFNRVMLMCQLS